MKTPQLVGVFLPLQLFQFSQLDISFFWAVFAKGRVCGREKDSLEEIKEQKEGKERKVNRHIAYHLFFPPLAHPGQQHPP